MSTLTPCIYSMKLKLKKIANSIYSSNIGWWRLPYIYIGLWIKIIERSCGVCPEAACNRDLARMHAREQLQPSPYRRRAYIRPLQCFHVKVNEFERILWANEHEVMPCTRYRPIMHVRRDIIDDPWTPCIGEYACRILWCMLTAWRGVHHVQLCTPKRYEAFPRIQSSDSTLYQDDENWRLVDCRPSTTSRQKLKRTISL